MSVEEIKPPIKKKPKALVGRKRKLPVRFDASSSSSDSEEEVVIEKPVPRPKRTSGTPAAFAGTSSNASHSVVTVASAAVVAPWIAVVSDIDAACSVTVTDAVSSASAYDAAHSAAPATNAAAPFELAAASNAPSNVSTCLLPQSSALQYLKMQGAPFESTTFQ